MKPELKALLGQSPGEARTGDSVATHCSSLRFSSFGKNVIFHSVYRFSKTEKFGSTFVTW